MVFRCTVHIHEAGADAEHLSLPVTIRCLQEKAVHQRDYAICSCSSDDEGARFAAGGSSLLMAVAAAQFQWREEHVLQPKK